jgi:hypothetical protein
MLMASLLKLLSPGSASTAPTSSQLRHDGVHALERLLQSTLILLASICARTLALGCHISCSRRLAVLHMSGVMLERCCAV